MHRQPCDVWRIDYQLRDDEDPVEAVKPENVLPRVQSHLTMIGEDAPWKPLWISIYNAKCLTLDDYRHGRVLFAGDAAHLVPIFGVRGLNSGLDDAGNLAWKLARVVRGEASPDLLDSYNTERLHATRENIAYGAKSTEFMAPPHFGFRLMREATLRLALENDAVRSLINPRQSTPAAYPVPAGSDANGLAGKPAPDAVFVDTRGAQRHVSELFGTGFVVLVFADEPLETKDATRYGVHCFGRATAPSAWARYAATPGLSVMVRPDGYVLAYLDRFDRPAIDALLEATLGATEVADA